MRRCFAKLGSTSTSSSASTVCRHLVSARCDRVGVPRGHVLCRAGPERDVPDTDRGRSAPRRGGGARRYRRPRGPGEGMPQPPDQPEESNPFLNGDSFNLQEQLEAMQQVYSQMNDTERQAFLQYLAQEEVRMNREAQEQLKPVAADGDAAQPAGPSSEPKTWETEILYPRIWELLLGSLPDPDAALMRKAFPRGWRGYGDLSRRQVLEGLARLAPSERRRLPGVIEKVYAIQDGVQAAVELREDMEAFERRSAVRRKRMAQQKGLALSDEDEEQLAVGAGEADAAGVQGDSQPGSYSELLSTIQQKLRQQQQQQPQQQQEAGEGGQGAGYGDWYGYGDRQQQPGASTSGTEGGSSTSSSTAGVDGLPGPLQERLGRMLGAYDKYVASGGWEAEMGRRQSAEMRNLIRLHEELTSLAAAEAALMAAAAAGRGGGGGGPGPLDVGMLQRRAEDLAGQLAEVLASRERLQDPAARSVVRYIETQLVVADPATGEPTFEADQDRLARLGQLIVAAQNWEAYRAYMAMYDSRHPELNLKPIMQAAGMSDSDEWWAQLPGLADLGVSDEGNNGNGSSSSSSGRTAGGGGAAAGGKRLAVDLDKVEAIAALEVDVLQFLGELEASGYSEDTFTRWYFHPVVGPRIRSGALLDPKAGAAGAAAGGGGLGGLLGGVLGSGGGMGMGMGGVDPAALLSKLMGGAPGDVPEIVRQAMAEAMAESGGGEQEAGGGGSKGREGAAGGRGRGAGMGAGMGAGSGTGRGGEAQGRGGQDAGAGAGQGQAGTGPGQVAGKVVERVWGAGLVGRGARGRGDGTGAPVRRRGSG